MANDIQSWVGREQVGRETVTEAMVARLGATVDGFSPPGDSLAPQGIHFLLAPPTVRRSEIGVDGHPVLGDFLPLIEGARRMWAGSAIQFLSPIEVGTTVERRSTVAAVSEKHGKSGPLVFVEVEHVYRGSGNDLVHERQTIVYRATQGAGPPRPGGESGAYAGHMATERADRPRAALPLLGSDL